MNAPQVLASLTRIGVVPVVRAESPERVEGAVEALIEGGIPVAEITMTVPGAASVIARCAARFRGRLTLGAGSVTDTETCAAVIDAGCVFVVTPVFKADVISACKRRGICVIAGALTPTEILSAGRPGPMRSRFFP
jgi:2-dehydro-3-deoxyphosphogluconate aldolase/(4S)-4-hydroxy-2-oxoglutarate aldolase